jgi:anti-sigma28 factor (negative regulator of flagellin synthesis)
VLASAGRDGTIAVKMVAAAVPPTPSHDRNAWLHALRDAIRSGQYRIDPHAVAEAALRDPAFRRHLLR